MFPFLAYRSRYCSAWTVDLFYKYLGVFKKSQGEKANFLASALILHQGIAVIEAQSFQLRLWDLRWLDFQKVL